MKLIKPMKPLFGMSLKDTSGTTLTEVMVMMVILGVSLTGIFGLVNSGQKLASLTDTRLAAVNIAREGLEAVTTLRDTFSLANFSSGQCDGLPNPAFFTINGRQIFDMPTVELDNCPVVATTGPSPTPSAAQPYYFLKDDKTLGYIAAAAGGSNTEVCMNEYGWYSQEYSIKDASAGPLVVPKTACNDVGVTSCGGNKTQSCKTRFQRKITFKECGGLPAGRTDICIVATSTVWWGSASDQTISLSQLITVK